MSAADQIAKLQNQGDNFTRRIELEKKKIEEMDKQVAAMQKKILEQRQKMGGVNATNENNKVYLSNLYFVQRLYSYFL